MLFPVFHRVSLLPKRQDTLGVRPLSRGLAAIVLLLSWSALRAEAGNPSQPTRVARAAVASTPAPTPRYKITQRPHLLAVGPMTLDVKPVAGPRVRRPPLLPPPKIVEPEPEVAPESVEPADTSMPTPAEPSAFSPDAPHTLLPTEKPVPPPAPEKKFEPKESVLVPADGGEPDLKDAIMYFDTPVGPHGARMSVPMAIPSTSPATAPQPESRATYRKEKE